jgi:hypothetical protein
VKDCNKDPRLATRSWSDGQKTRDAGNMHDKLRDIGSAFLAFPQENAIIAALRLVLPAASY